ncbi:MAG: hypothetical protein JWO36_4667 [Myxococcales bacterium]|nr:hypothetical protein [Myxococcales bacterium]
MLQRGALVLTLVVAAPMTGHADPFADQADLATVRSQIGWGTSINPDRVGVWSEGGWNGGTHRAEVAATVEATVFARASVFATAQYGGVYTNTRPTLGAAYQLIDPRKGANGARISVAYKPEGLTEPEGELESALVLSRRIGGDAFRARLAYGQDPEGRESDAEAGASYMHRLDTSFELGVTSRYRRAIKVKTTVEPRWDFIGGAVGGYVRGRSRFELLLGADSIAHTLGPTQTGVVGLVSVGTEI